MKKNSICTIVKDEGIEDNFKAYISYSGIREMKFLSFTVKYVSGNKPDGNFMFPLDNVGHPDKPLVINKCRFLVQEYSPERVIMKYIGK